MFSGCGSLLSVKGSTMARRKIEGPTRQLFASVREDIYLLAKAKAAEKRVSMRVLLEEALEMYLGIDGSPSEYREVVEDSSIWNDEYLKMQSQRPVGTPVELSADEAKKIAREAFL